MLLFLCIRDYDDCGRSVTDIMSYELTRPPVVMMVVVLSFCLFIDFKQAVIVVVR